MRRIYLKRQGTKKCQFPKSGFIPGLRWLCIITITLSVASWLSFEAAAQDQVKEIREVAVNAFNKFPVLETLQKERSDLTQIRLFTPIWLLKVWQDDAITVEKISDSPETFYVKIPVWFSGRDKSGQRATAGRDFGIKVARGTTSQWEILSQEFGPDQPVDLRRQINSFLTQTATFIFAVFITIGFFVLVLHYGSMQAGTSSSEGGTLAPTVFLTWLISIPLVGYQAWVYFDSAWMVLLCAGIQFFSGRFLLRLFLRKDT